MCNFFADCKRDCHTYRSHFIHWQHVKKYCENKDPDFLHYNTYKRLYQNGDIDKPELKRRKRSSSLINYKKYEEYLVKNLVSDIVNDIIDKIIE